MISLAEFLLKTQNVHNGHLQTEIKGMSFEDAVQLCKDLEEVTDNRYCFVVEYWPEGDMTIYQKQYWNIGEHQLGCTDRIILGINNSN